MPGCPRAASRGRIATAFPHITLDSINMEPDYPITFCSPPLFFFPFLVYLKPQITVQHDFKPDESMGKRVWGRRAVGLHQGDGHTSPFALTPQPGSPVLAEGGSSAPSVLFRANAARRTSPTRPVTFFCWERLWKSPTQVPGTASSSPIEQAALRPHPHPFSLLVMGQPPTADVLTGMTPKMGRAALWSPVSSPTPQTPPQPAQPR